MTIPFFPLGILFALSVLFSVLLRRYALLRGLQDIPNERSSHQRPTPREAEWPSC